MITVARSFGFTVTKEPTMYVYDKGARRPDITFHTAHPVATDITIVTPDDDAPGEAAKQAAKEKEKSHSSAVNKLNHRFIAAPFESMGLFGKSTETLINDLARELPSQQEYDFRREMQLEIASALARGRARAMFGISQRRRYND